MPSKKREIVLDGYCFVGFAHRITVMSKGNMDEEELVAIVKLYEEHYASSREGGVLHGGKWQWCLNSEECRKAVYVPLNEIEKNQGKIVCSHRCANKVRGLPLPVFSKVVKPIKKANKKKERTVAIGCYTFLIGDRRIVVASQNKHDEAELKTIAKLYADYKRKNYYAGRPLVGEWRWCLDPECNNAFYGRRHRMKEGRSVCCSQPCAGKVFGTQQGQQVGGGGLRMAAKRVAKIRITKRERRQVQEKEKTPVAILPVPKTVVEAKSDLEKPRKIRLQCLKCKATVDRILTNPCICPVCKEASVFITVAAESKKS